MESILKNIFKIRSLDVYVIEVEDSTYNESIFPKWKINYIRRNREFYIKYKEYLIKKMLIVLFLIKIVFI